MVSVHLDTQITSLNESATPPHEYVELLMFNLPSNLGQLQTPFTSSSVAIFPVSILKGTIGLVRAPDDEWSKKSIIELCN